MPDLPTRRRNVKSLRRLQGRRKEKVMVQRYRPDELEMIGMHPESDGDYVDYADYTALERELQMIDELMARRPALDDCKTRYDKISKVITTAAQKDALERERDELKEAFAKDEKAYAELSEKYFRLEQDNALLRKRLEPIKTAAIALVQRLELDKDVKNNNWWLNERAKIMEVIDDNEGCDEN
jgi:hypothetical protein